MTTGIKSLKINRTQIAKAVGVDLAHISRIFSRKSTPSLELAIKIAGYLGITVDELCQELGIGADLKSNS